MQSVDTTDKKHQKLYETVVNRGMRLQRLVSKSSFFSADLDFDDWQKLKTAFWNDYVYPRVEPIYRVLFPNDLKDFRRPGLESAWRLIVAVCHWLNQEGFFHLYKEYVYFIDHDLSSMTLSGCVGFSRCPVESFVNFASKALYSRK